VTGRVVLTARRGLAPPRSIPSPGEEILLAATTAFAIILITLSGWQLYW
jgi:hypothetical protein